MQKIFEKIRITEKDDIKESREAERYVDKITYEVYKELKQKLKDNLSKEIKTCVKHVKKDHEWGLGIPDIKLNTYRNAHITFKQILWINPYDNENCVCFSRDFEKYLKESTLFNSNQLPDNRDKATAYGKFGSYEVYSKSFDIGDWIYIYIKDVSSIDPLIEVIKKIGIWN